MGRRGNNYSGARWAHSRRPRTPKPQTTTVTDWSMTPPTDREVALPARANGRPHLSECLLFIDPSLHCTCDDDSPEWTI